ncbi:rust resistance kinase Lr10-like [Cornus florida]|uniref:rust resistance kinase Lr10-like n=1 Tax=Cornus florida TaxID=4283 RepID=UPI0028A10206|nr:rust resistance kinase Lr10-like [Cornus florida]
MGSKSPPTLLLAYFSLLIFSFLAESQARSLQQVCSSSCGDIKNISYPFRLKGDPESCGDHDYELSCEDNKTILEYYSGRYYVKRISYTMRTIRIVDVNFVNGTCNLPYHSLSPDVVDSDIRYEDAQIGLNFMYASFINCSGIITDPTYRKLPCMGGNTSHVYVVYGSMLSSLPERCSFISMLPIDFRDLNDTILNLLESGFDMGWSVECRDCQLSNQSCYLAKFELPFDYYCSDYGPYADGIISTIVKIAFSLLGSFLIVIILIARFILAPIIILVFLIHKFRKDRKPVDKVETFLQNQQSLMPKRYSYTDLVAMTNHFRDKLGQGGFGSVYKGQLPGGYLIAVKMLENTKFSGEEFINEVSTIGRIHHVNVVQLAGFCSEGSKRALVYEYMPNGSLDKHIFAKEGKGQSFCWGNILEIALGTARGIEYLHCGCDVCILHFDIKPHNILLDQNFVPKVADFGLAKFHAKENDFVSISTTRGTIGYIAPELISRNFGAVSSKSDVYSFGMLLLEMAGRRKNVDEKAKSESKVYFPSWVYDNLDKGGDLELETVSDIEIGIARKLCMVGLWCIQMKASDRPSMTKVVEMLEGNIDDLKMPPKPFMCSPKRASINESRSDSSTEIFSESIEECLYGDRNVYSHQSVV